MKSSNYLAVLQKDERLSEEEVRAVSAHLLSNLPQMKLLFKVHQTHSSGSSSILLLVSACLGRRPGGRQEDGAVRKSLQHEEGHPGERYHLSYGAGVLMIANETITISCQAQ